MKELHPFGLGVSYPDLVIFLGTIWIKRRFF